MAVSTQRRVLTYIITTDCVEKALVAKEGEGDAVAKILGDLVAPTMNEEKVTFFIQYRSPDNPLSFFIYKLYDDHSGWDAHNSSEHFLAVVDELVSLCAHRNAFLSFRLLHWVNQAQRAALRKPLPVIQLMK